MMPIGKVICSSSFTATTRYVLEKEQAQWLDGTMLGANAKELVQEFEFSRRNNLAIERPCLHLILSYSKTDEQRQHLDNELLAALAEEHFSGCAVLSRWHRPLAALDPEVYRQQLETFKEEELHHYQMFSAVHEDVHHRHTHTVGSRINVLDGKCLETWQNRLKSQYVIRELEERYGLEINQSSSEKDRRGLSRRQLEKQSETDRKPVQLELQETLDATLPQVKTLDGLVDALRESGVDMRLYQRETGELYGVSYAKDGVAFRGSALGKKYSFKGLEKSLGQSLEADAPTLRLESVTQPAIAPALIQAPESQPVAVAPALRRALEPQPVAIEPALTETADQAAGLTEPIGADSDRVDALTRQQTEANLQALALSRQAWAQEMARIAAQILQLTRKAEYEGEHYRWVLNDRVLTIEAKDGRGVLVKYQRHDMMVNHAITEADKNYFQAQAKKAVAKAQLGR